MRDYTVKEHLSYNLMVYFIFFSVISGQQQNQHTCRNTHSHIVQQRFYSSLPSTSCLQTTQILAVAVVTLASPLHPPPPRRIWPLKTSTRCAPTRRRELDTKHRFPNCWLFARLCTSGVFHLQAARFCKNKTFLYKLFPSQFIVLAAPCERLKK